jgi:thiopeptide-type bacteriocin biosynthesis protein
MSMLSALIDDPAPDERLAIAMMGVDRLFADCGLDVPRRLGSVENLRADVGHELPVQLTAKRRLDARFRTERVALAGALGSRGTSPRSPSLAAADLAFAGRSQAMAPIVTELRDLRRQGRLSRDIFELALSYVHMHVNRLVPSHPRVHELHVYDFLARHYRSTLATTVSSIT